MPSRDHLVLQVESRHARRFGDDVLWTMEVVLVVTAVQRVCHNRCQCATPASCSTGPLLVIRDGRGYIAQAHTQQAADVDAHLHRRSHGENVDTVVLLRRSDSRKRFWNHLSMFRASRLPTTAVCAAACIGNGSGYPAPAPANMAARR